MKLAAVLTVLLLGVSVTAAPVPKLSPPETGASKNKRLRAYYDQLQADLGVTPEVVPGRALRGFAGKSSESARRVAKMDHTNFCAISSSRISRTVSGMMVRCSSRKKRPISCSASLL